jgi:hypothetical protein
MWSSHRGETPLDEWGRPLVYRAPGKHGDFDLYSCGANGVDQDGHLDDISNWAGVNDGFHWKATWPAGRFTIAIGVVLGMGTLLLYRFFRWRIIAPLAASLVCLGVFLGCLLLMHPGVVPTRNQPLGVCSAVAFCAFGLLLIFFTLNVRKKA